MISLTYFSCISSKGWVFFVIWFATYVWISAGNFSDGSFIVVINFQGVFRCRKDSFNESPPYQFTILGGKEVMMGGIGQPLLAPLPAHFKAFKVFKRQCTFVRWYPNQTMTKALYERKISTKEVKYWSHIYSDILLEVVEMME